MIKNRPLVSVVIPVYNVEKFLCQCLDSIIGQSYDNLEIIIVDDGSTDSCPQLCDSYAQKDNRIHVIHKKNGGLADARNCGIEICNGEYITFIDSDDFVSSNYIEELYRALDQCRTCISTCDKVDYRNGQCPKVYTTNTSNIFLYDTETAVKEILQEKRFLTTAWGKLYDVKLFSDIRFPKGRIFEDLFTTWRILDKVDKIAFTSGSKYFYRHNPDSIMNSSFTSKNMDFIDAHESILNYTRIKYPHFINYARQRYARYATAYIFRALITRYRDTVDIEQMAVVLIKHLFPFLTSQYSIGKKGFALVVVCLYPSFKILKLLQSIKKRKG